MYLDIMSKAYVVICGIDLPIGYEYTWIYDMFSHAFLYVICTILKGDSLEFF